MTDSLNMDFCFDELPDDFTETTYAENNQRHYVRVHKTRETATEMVVAVYDFGGSDPSTIDSSKHYKYCRVVMTLPLGQGSNLGTLRYTVTWKNDVPVETYLKKKMFNNPLVRTFDMSDRQTYTWVPNTGGHRWLCVSPQNYKVASFDRLPPEVKATGRVNCVTVYRTFNHLILEIVTSLTLMRYMETRLR